MLKIKVCVHLGCADVGVPQQFLHATQVAARLKQVRCEAVAEQMRVDPLGQAGRFRSLFYPGLHAARADSRAFGAGKNRLLCGACDG